MSLTDKELKQLHQLELDIIKEIKRICEKNDIQFFAIAGTCLGAVRHQGFIPWDEDADIGMLREEYNRFIKACENELDQEKYFLQTNQTDCYYTHAFAKIRVIGTSIKEELSKDTKCHDGIYVDIFPFDNVPASIFQRQKQSIGRFFWKNLLAYKLDYNIGANRNPILQVAYKSLAKMTPYNFILNIKNRVFQKYNDENTEYIVTAEGSYGYEKEIIPRKWTESLEERQFEDITLPIFKEYDAYLKYMYQQYDIIPSDIEKNKHNILSVDFGEYGEEI